MHGMILKYLNFFIFIY